jgi:hypothetical protein
MSPKRGQHGKAPGRSKQRSGLGSWLKGLKRGQRIGLIVAVAIVVIAAGVGIAVAASSKTKSSNPPSHKTTTTTTTTQASKTTSATCPLTGLPAPGGKVPRHVALAIKIGNDPASRPQSGLQAADIVYEEMAEGGITRYMAVFQCNSAPLVGPVRSVRWDDWNILEGYGHAILAYSGGIVPWTEEAASLSWIHDADGSVYPAAHAFYRYSSNTLPASQGAPYNYYTSTAALWKVFPKAKTVPPRMFHFSKTLSAQAISLASVSIPFSESSPVVWRWNAATNQWLRYYDTLADKAPSGTQFHATNVVIQKVGSRLGPYNESGPDSRDVESITVGTGKVYVLRNGHVEEGTWSRASGSDVTTFKFADGQPITLEPGQTWYEVVPDYITASFTK